MWLPLCRALGLSLAAHCVRVRMRLVKVRLKVWRAVSREWVEMRTDSWLEMDALRIVEHSVRIEG